MLLQYVTSYFIKNSVVLTAVNCCLRSGMRKTAGLHTLKSQTEKRTRATTVTSRQPIQTPKRYYIMTELAMNTVRFRSAGVPLSTGISCVSYSAAFYRAFLMKCHKLKPTVTLQVGN